MKWHRAGNWVWLMLAVWVLTLAAASLAYTNSAFGQLDLLVDVRHEIVSRYVEAPDEKKLMEAAVRGMVDALKDPHTAYLSPEEMEAFDDQVMGRFSGIGAEVTIDEQLRRLKIVTPLEDSPAWRAGLLAGDIVLEIEGETTLDLTITEAVKRLKGEAGTPVTLTVRHETGDEVKITIVRELINVRSVRGFRRNGENHWTYMIDPQRRIGYVKIRQFTDRTASELREALEQLRREEVRGLILDLRFDPGGLLPAAIAVSDMFLDAGKTIVSTRGRTMPERIERSTSARALGDDVPIVVLANEASASAAEIVTGALMDNGRAKFVGMRTFGKGSVQQVRMLEGGQGAIKITTAYYYLPSGRVIHRREDSETWGVDPEDGYFVPMTPDQIRDMQKVQLDGTILRDVEPAQVTPLWIAEKLADKQLAAGLETLIGRLESGAWVPVGESGADTVAKAARRELLLNQKQMIQEGLTRVEDELAKLEAGEDEAAAAPADEVTETSRDVLRQPEPALP